MKAYKINKNNREEKRIAVREWNSFISFKQTLFTFFKFYYENIVCIN